MSDMKPPSRYSVSTGVEGEYEPGSDGRVLRNKLGITDPVAMDRAEYEALLRVQEKYYGIIAPETRFTTSLIRRMHRGFLGRIYEWAGRYRSVDLERDGFAWPPAYLVAQNMRLFGREVLAVRTPCKPGPLQRVAGDIAVVHAELLLVHPFRDGNGRLARLIADLMSLQSGYPALDFGFENDSTASDEYIRAVGMGYARRYERLTKLIAEAVGSSLKSLGR